MSLTEKLHAGGFLISCADGNLSFDNATLAMGENLQAGAVLALVNSQYVELAAGASDASGVAVAVLFAATDATSAAKKCAVVARVAEVNGDELAWPAGATAPQKAAAVADLALQHIVVR